MAGTRSLKSNMSPRSSASQIRKVPTVDNAAAFSALPAATCVFQQTSIPALRPERVEGPGREVPKRSMAIGSQAAASTE